MTGSTETKTSEQDPKLEANKKTIQAFYDAAINKRDFDAASKLVGTRYVQHNPLIADGLEGLKAS
jgi:predicted SnoaL-like aldol condensation-catalyzing enzyme